MKYRDRCRRNQELGQGLRIVLLISRYLCAACHIIRRILPDDLAPKKHYDMDIITAVIDGTIDSDTLEFERYPCARTMERWQTWYAQNDSQIDEKLNQAQPTLLAYGLMVLFALVPSLLKQRYCVDSWLSFILQIIYNTGSSLASLRRKDSPG